MVFMEGTMKTLFMLILILGFTSLALAENVTIDGVTYTNVQWGAVQGTSISMTYDSGVASIPVAKLPRHVQRQLGLDPAKLAVQQAEQQQREADQIKKWEALGYVWRHGRWVTAEESAKYLDAKATANALRPVLETSLTNNSLLADIDALDPGVETTSIGEKRARLLALQKYGQEAYQPAIQELLAACNVAMDLQQALQRETAAMRSAPDRYRDAVTALNGYPARNIVEAAAIDDLREQAIATENFNQMVASLRRDARQHCEAAADLKAHADAAVALQVGSNALP
jgi:hypothetical protein